MTSNATSPRLLLRAAFGALVALFAACSSPNPYVENRAALDGSYAALQKGDYPAAARQSEELFAARASQASEFELQRYYAVYVCAQAHIQAALHKPFLKEPAPAESSLGIGGSDDAGHATVDSTTAHWLAAAYYSRFARGLFPAASKEPTKVEEEELLPPGLKQVSLQTTAQNLDLTRLALLRRLDFDEECSRVISASPDLLNMAKCQAVLTAAELPPELQPLIFYAGFAHQRLHSNATDSRSQLDTYRLGAQARELADKTPGALLSPEDGAEVAQWAELHPNFEFHCKCGNKFQLDTIRCSVCAWTLVQATIHTKPK